MQPGLLIRLRPVGPWRFGPADGGHDRVDSLYRSDRLYSAVTLAMQRLDLLDEWLQATAHAPVPAVTFSSLFPFQGDTLFAIPPTSLWPPPTSLLNTPSPVFLAKIRWKMARFVPLTVIDALITGQPILADQWLPDPESACLLRRDRPNASPFRVVMRGTAGVDRLAGISDEVRSLACVEFEQTAGLWTVARFADGAQERQWSGRIQAAFRLLSDSGFGGGRSKGWGQTQAAEFQAGVWPQLLLPKLGRLLRNSPSAAAEDATDSLYWLLSLYSPAVSDKVDWNGGDYSLAVRSGRVESLSGQGELKKSVRMINEGCVLSAANEPVGMAVDVAPEGFAHPVYRSGLALALRLPVVEIQSQDKNAVEEPTTAEAFPEIAPEPAEELAVEAAPQVHTEAPLTENALENGEPAEESAVESPLQVHSEASLAENERADSEPAEDLLAEIVPQIHAEAPLTENVPETSELAEEPTVEAAPQVHTEAPLAESALENSEPTQEPALEAALPEPADESASEPIEEIPQVPTEAPIAENAALIPEETHTEEPQDESPAAGEKEQPHDEV